LGGGNAAEDPTEEAGGDEGGWERRRWVALDGAGGSEAMAGKPTAGAR